MIPKLLVTQRGCAEHYLPLIYALGLKGNRDDVAFFNDKTVGGSLTMTSVKFG